MTTATTKRRRKKNGAALPGRKPAPRRNAAHDALIENATRNTLAANPLVGVRRKDVVSAATVLMGKLARKPGVVFWTGEQILRWYQRAKGSENPLAAPPVIPSTDRRARGSARERRRAAPRRGR